MSSILKISDAATLAIHAMTFLTLKQDKLLSNHELATTLGASEHHLSKVMQRLVKAGLVNSHRGPSGGFNLDTDPKKTTLLEVYEAIEGPLKPSTCLLGASVCNDNCMLGNLVASINQQVSDYFKNTTLVNLAENLTLKTGGLNNAG